MGCQLTALREDHLWQTRCNEITQSPCEFCQYRNQGRPTAGAECRTSAQSLLTETQAEAADLTASV